MDHRPKDNKASFHFAAYTGHVETILWESHWLHPQSQAPSVSYSPPWTRSFCWHAVDYISRRVYMMMTGLLTSVQKLKRLLSQFK